MDASRFAEVQRDLVEWGLLETDDEVRLSRRFRAALARAAMALQAEEQAGRRPEGHAVENAVAAALDGYPLPAGAVAGREHRAFLVAVEVASLPPAVRALLGL